jgi:hypothetical protein
VQQIPGDVNPIFQQDILHGAANVGHFAAGGVLWQLGQSLSDQYKDRPFAVQPEHIHVSVYETSSCSENNPACGPGYQTQKGIKPRLCFFVTASNRLPGSSFENAFCIAQYNPVAWIDTQPGLDTALP